MKKKSTHWRDGGEVSERERGEGEIWGDRRGESLFTVLGIAVTVAVALAVGKKEKLEHAATGVFVCLFFCLFVWCTVCVGGIGMGLGWD
jgi:hypothetical protein